MLKYLVFLFLSSVTLFSCVDTITIPEGESGKLVLNCEMMKGSGEITATLSTSADLSGSTTIEYPKDATITVSVGIDDVYNLAYNEDRDKYVTLSAVPAGFWNKSEKFRINGNVPDGRFEPVSAQVTIPKVNSISNIIGITSEIVSREEVNFMTKSIEITIDEPKIKPAYYYLDLSEKLTTYILDAMGNIVYNISEEELEVNIDEILSGGAGISELNHLNGVLIDHSRLIDNKFTLSISSNFPYELDDQVFDILQTNLVAVNKEYYDFHRAYSNTGEVNGGAPTYQDPAIWPTNIDNGFGLFSVSIQKEESITIQ